MTPRPDHRTRRSRTIGAAIERVPRALLSGALMLCLCAPAVWAQGGEELSAGSVLDWDKISAAEGGFTGQLGSDNLFGAALAAIADLNGDGTRDLIVGAEADDDGGLGRGALWVLFMNPDGTVGSHQKISSLAGGFGGVLENLDAFGSAVAETGDLNDDNLPDVLVGARQDDDGGVSKGAAWLLHLAIDGTVLSEQKISETAGGFGGDLSVGDEFGASVVSLGDLDGDGEDDFAVGAPGDDDGAVDAGAVWILFRNADGTIKSEAKISQTSGGFGGGLATEDFFGASLAVVGDLNDDGRDELAVGAPYKQAGPFSEGRVFILFLDTDGTVASHQEIAAGEGGMPDVLSLGDGFGAALAGVGDVDKDGVPDLAVGADGDDDGGLAVGAVYVLSLTAGGEVGSANKISALSGGFGGELDILDAFGCGLAALGDFDGDLKQDLAVGSWGDDDGGADMGAVWSLYLDDGSGLSVTGASPDTGLYYGGTPVTVQGTGFEAAAFLEVRFDGVPAGNVAFISDTELSCTTPPGPKGEAVKVSVRQGGALAGLEGAYTYVGTEILGMSVAAGNLLGGTTVTIDLALGGDALDTAVTMGGQPALLLSADEDSVTVVTPGVPEATIADVVVATSNGSDTAAEAWTFTPHLGIEVVGGAQAGGDIIFDVTADPAATGEFLWLWFGNPAQPVNQTLTGIAGVLHETALVLILQGVPADGNPVVLPFLAQHPALAGIPIGVQGVVTGEGDFKGSFTNASTFILPP